MRYLKNHVFGIVLTLSTAFALAMEPLKPEPEHKFFEAEYKTSEPGDQALKPPKPYVRPQDNFFEYVNGKWSEETCTNLTDEVSATIRRQLETCLKDTLDTADPGGELPKEINRNPSTREELKKLYERQLRNGIYKLYKSLTDISPQNQEAMKATLKKEFFLIDRMTKKSDIPTVLGHLNSIGVYPLVQPDITMTNSLNISIKPVSGGTDIKIENIKRVFDQSGVEVIDDKTANSIIKIIVLIQQMVNDSEEMRSGIMYRHVHYEQFPVYNTPKDLLPWASYLQTAELSNKIQFVHYPPTYFKLLNSKLGLLGSDSIFSTSPNLASLKAYLKFELLDTYLNHHGLRNLLVTPHNLEKIRENAIVQLRRNIPDFYRLCFEANEPEINKIIDNVKNSYKEMMTNTPFMNDSTKQNALKRLDGIHWYVKAYPPELPNPLPDEEMSNIDPIANLKFLETYYYRQYISRLGGEYDDLQLWLDSAQDISGERSGAFHSQGQSVFVAFEGLTFPLFAAGNNAINYSGLAFTLGHELGHSLEPLQYRDFNIPVYWMDNQAENRYEKIAMQLNPPLSSKNELLNVSKEEIADSIGIRIAYNAYSKLLETHGITKGNGEWKIKMQKFFYDFAYSMYEDDPKCDYSNINIRNLTHPRSDKRVNKVLSHMDEFYEVYDVEQGDKMYLEPVKRIKVW